MSNEQHASTAPDIDALALDVARRFTEEWDPQRRASLQVAIIQAIRTAHVQPAELTAAQGVELPPLPEAFEAEFAIPGASPVSVYSAEQMQDYARDALAATGKQQVGELQGDALDVEWLKERISSIHSTVSLGHQTGPHAYAGEDFGRYLAEAAGACQQIMRALAALAARQPVAQEPVAVVGPDFNLFWAGSGPIAPLVKCHGIVPGSLLYAAPPAQGIDLGPGVRAIADERQRQVDAEGYSAESDAEYKAGELANAALAYVQVAAMDLAAGGRSHVATRSPPACWPWHRLWWKPKDARRDLVRAGALIAAQIDLIDSQRDAAPGVSHG
ncbi:hypothetical protein [Stenotrophomonas sp.]|uniref:hypothetical protein n=1 Tax=Stenotrophomonas sp. TaxID=69392 RepID=UPI00289B70C8|nr:hypothetical protein [Stenotrophomonas sp.]